MQQGTKIDNLLFHAIKKGFNAAHCLQQKNELL